MAAAVANETTAAETTETVEAVMEATTTTMDMGETPTDVIAETDEVPRMVTDEVRDRVEDVNPVEWVDQEEWEEWAWAADPEASSVSIL